uniref:Uncharacterized protein n=1 Tax=Arundo donax TaxID=35708 RepID=A0A0A9B2S4_ARUDO
MLLSISTGTARRPWRRRCEPGHSFRLLSTISGAPASFTRARRRRPGPWKK